jgi:hypothetical protein
MLSVNIYGSQQKIPCQWKNFLAVGKNKEEIMEFLFDSWSKSNALTLRGIELFTTHKEQCHRYYMLQSERANIQPRRSRYKNAMPCFACINELPQHDYQEIIKRVLRDWKSKESENHIPRQG